MRAKLIEVAAFLDRVERYRAANDFRCVALRAAAALLVDGKPERARRILEASREAAGRGLGAVQIDGRMIDAANIRMAERTLATSPDAQAELDTEEPGGLSARL